MGCDNVLATMRAHQLSSQSGDNDLASSFDLFSALQLCAASVIIILGRYKIDGSRNERDLRVIIVQIQFHDGIQVSWCYICAATSLLPQLQNYTVKTQQLLQPIVLVTVVPVTVHTTSQMQEIILY